MAERRPGAGAGGRPPRIPRQPEGGGFRGPIYQPEEPEPGLTLPRIANNEWRSHYAAALTGADKASIGLWLGVTRRTVERWITLAGERRRPFPLAGLPTDPCEWPAHLQRRLALTSTLFWGRRSPLHPRGLLKRFEERFCGIYDLAREVGGIAQGTRDPWLAAVWVNVHAARDDAAGQWVLAVSYWQIHRLSPRRVPYREAKDYDEAYPAPPEPVIPDSGPVAGMLLSCPVPGFDYPAGDWEANLAGQVEDVD